MGNHKTEKAMPRDERKRDLAAVELDRRLVEEINILKLEGALFCFDPREAKRRNGKITLADARKSAVTVEIHPNYGQPSVLAYKVLQAIFLKVAETGCTVSENGCCLYEPTASFSARELSMLVGRSWGGKTSEELYQAIMQLRRTSITASLYDKETDQWIIADFEVLPTAVFSGRGKTITRCVVELHPKIVDSINRRHVATFNLARLSSLDTIGLVLYKRIFFHFSNLMHESKRHGSLKFTKDYEAMCHEWLGGLKPLQYRAQILRDQLGPHFEKLRATGVIGRDPMVEKNKAGTGYNVTFHPGAGFYEDYKAYYLGERPLRIPSRTVADYQEIKALELVAHFHRQLGHDHTRFEDHETAYADELLATYSDAEIRDLIAYGITEARRTKWDEMRFFGALKRFVEAWSSGAALKKERARREAVVEACPYCTKDGMLELKERVTGRLFLHLCPHKADHVAKIEERFRASRI